MPAKYKSKTGRRAQEKAPVKSRRAFSVFAVVIMFGVGILAAWAMMLQIPAIDNFQSRRVAESTKIYDRTGNILLYDVHGTMRRTAVPLSEISLNIRNAAIAVEDATFYQHYGFRPLSFLRALSVDILSLKFVQGGSTITQQVVKNALLTQDKTIIRKVKEIVLAIKLERAYSKDQILETYLNETSYGGTIYGVEEASQYFFGLSAKDVSLAQAAYMAALPQAPTRYSPYGNHRDELESRKNFVLSKMKENKFITDSEYENALQEKVEFKDTAEAGIKAPHFVFFVREYLEGKYGADAVERSGLQVITTLDYDLQKRAEEILTKAALSNEKNFNASNAGLVAIDPKTGQILTMVGSRGYFDPEIEGKVNIALANRQPGSAFKPFVYATALGKGYTPETVVFDLQTQFSTFCEPSDVANSEPPCYSPGNYDEKFRGPMTLRDAIAQSVNVPSVKILYLAGVTDSLKTANDMGITTLGDKNQYGLTLVLGGGEVNLLEMTGAYGVFANDGVRNSPTGIMSVKDAAGNILETYEQNASRVLDSQIARQMNDILSDNIARTPEFGAYSPLYFPDAAVAAKTGTTNDYHDAWVIGYTTGVSLGAWAGNNDNSPMQKKIAAFIVAPMWHEVFAYALQKYSSEPFAPAAPEAELDSLPPVLRGDWNTDPSRGVHEIIFWTKKGGPRSGPPENPASDPQFALWEYPVQLWAAANPAKIAPSTPMSARPVAQEDGFFITSPQSGITVPSFASIVIAVAHSRPESISKVSYYLNGVFIGASTQAPFTISTFPASHGPVTLRAVAESASGSEEKTTSFTIQ
ncbi:MAG TPA: PBP1A family penicillin-binding protein [Candidatus Paceibacterota bacterium]|nr:PBP1A family penicillin-binding protein [Candidatus Paceibacterota bacterium]